MNKLPRALDCLDQLSKRCRYVGWFSQLFWYSAYEMIIHLCTNMGKNAWNLPPAFAKQIYDLFVTVSLVPSDRQIITSDDLQLNVKRILASVNILKYPRKFRCFDALKGYINCLIKENSFTLTISILSLKTLFVHSHSKITLWA